MTYHIRGWRETAPKHVVMLSAHCCIRVQKQAHALRQLGWRVDSLSLRRPSDTNAFDYTFVPRFEAKLPDLQPKRLEAALLDSGASIIHVHNEPDWLMRVADKASNGRPVVYDCHDLEYNRFGEVRADETFAFARADGVINVSEAHRDFAYSLHPWTAPSAVTMSLPRRDKIPTYTGPKLGVVYEGGLHPPGKCAWRDLSVPCQVFADAGIRFDILTTESMKRHYPNVLGFMGYDRMLEEVSRHSFGFLGHDPAHPVYEQAMPNKLWEYAACGVIPLIINAREAARVFGSGIVASSTAEAVMQMRTVDVHALRADVLAHAQFMDTEIGNTVGLYERLLG